MVDIQCQFIPPPEAPVFEPTLEEFKDPLAYIAKIKPIAEKTGICKIKPPSSWQPSFAVDVDTFKFTPRRQRLNELEAGTRLKLNFLDKLARFWELQGNSLRIPNVERKVLDLFTLQKIVTEEGGFENVTKERRWTKIGGRLGYPPSKGVGSTLRSHYERILYPFDLFNAGVTVVNENQPEVKEDKKGETKEDIKEETKEKVTEETKEKPTEDITDSSLEVKTTKSVNNCDNDTVNSDVCSETGELKINEDELVEGEGYKPHNIADTEAQGGFTRRSKRERAAAAAARIDYTGNKELKKLQFFGAGPKAATAESVTVDEINDARTSRTKSKKVCYVDLYICLTCGRGDGEDCMLLCDGCDAAYHTYCLIPPLNDIPKGDWRCPKCISLLCKKPHEAFGFEQAKIQYSLTTFGEMADQFKLDYFNMPVHMVPYSTVEKEFWRLVNCIEEDVTVEYGADIHALEMGSGFPTKETENLMPEDEEYLNSGWNLNNLPVLGTSILKYINADVSGMKVPWCYVGMCFSSFCWHIEDHWSYSINYMHWGEPKTWYGVPGGKAELLEEVMKRNAPDLFNQSPDLLHHITTIMNPNILMAYGVPIVRTDQCAGEFVITFPRSYHAGFNQGYNFAEAVNFCPADWLHIGLECIDHYRSVKRNCVFSHEELICKMASESEHLDLNLAAATHQDMLCLVDVEKKLREKVLAEGIEESTREAFELLNDDERQCYLCSTTCFLSGVTCSCKEARIVCLHHVKDLCDCEPSKKTLRYRYTLDELPNMLQKLKGRVESFDNWAFKVKSALERGESATEKPDLLDLHELLQEADEKNFPDTPLLDRINATISEAEKCATVANQLITKKVRTRNRHTPDGKHIAKLNLQELELFSNQVNELPCVIKEAQMIKDLLQKVLDFQKEAQLSLEEAVPDSLKLEKLISTGIALDVDLKEIPRLKQVLEQAKWLDNVNVTLADPSKVTLEAMRSLIESGVGLAPHDACEKSMSDLQDLLTSSERVEEKARQWLNSRPHRLPNTGEEIVEEASSVPSHLPSVELLRDALKRASELMAKITAIQTGEHYPYLDVLEGLVNKGKSVPVYLEQLVQMETSVNTAKTWRERTARTFLKKNSTFSLYEVLSPRSTIGTNISTTFKPRKRKPKDGSDNKDGTSIDSRIETILEEPKDPKATVAAFKLAEQREIDAMLELRHANMAKTSVTSGLNPAEVKYCVCRKPSQGFMLQCELCKDWFHSACVPLPKSANLKNKSSSSSMVSAAKDLKFLCPLCLRSRRPRLETILSLLVSLQKLPVRLAEGEALQCLTERSMAWQDKARQALLTEEVSAALAKLSILSQRASQQAAREKTQKIINAELLKAANNPDLQEHLQSVSHGAFTTTGTVDSANLISTPDAVAGEEIVGTESTIDSPSVVPGSTVEEILMPSIDANCNTMINPTPVTDVSEHAYSSMSKAAPPTSPRMGRKPAAYCSATSDDPVINLSPLVKEQLELLLMEGDLLEVSLDETQHIWKILQGCQSNLTTESLINIQMNDMDDKMDDISPTGFATEKKKRKRKKENVSERGKPEDSTLKVKKKKIRKLKELKGKLKEGNINRKYNNSEVIGEKKLLKQVKKIPRVQQLNEGAALGMAADSDNDEDCSASKCLKPVGQEVNWVQCDKCQLWFHLLCIGLHQSELDENADFVCGRCKHGSQPKKPVQIRKKRALPKQTLKIKKKSSSSVYNKMTGLMSITGAPKDLMDVDDGEDLIIDEDVIHSRAKKYPSHTDADEIAEFPNFVQTTVSDGCVPERSPKSVSPDPTVHNVMVDVLKEFVNSGKKNNGKADSDDMGSEIVDVGSEPIKSTETVIQVDNANSSLPENNMLKSPKPLPIIPIIANVKAKPSTNNVVEPIKSCKIGQPPVVIQKPLLLEKTDDSLTGDDRHDTMDVIVSQSTVCDPSLMTTVTTVAVVHSTITSPVVATASPIQTVHPIIVSSTKPSTSHPSTHSSTHTTTHTSMHPTTHSTITHPSTHPSMDSTTQPSTDTSSQP